MSNNETEDPIKAYARECFDRILNEPDPTKRNEIRKEIIRGKTIDIEEYIAKMKEAQAAEQAWVESHVLKTTKDCKEFLAANAERLFCDTNWRNDEREIVTLVMSDPATWARSGKMLVNPPPGNHDLPYTHERRMPPGVAERGQWVRCFMPGKSVAARLPVDVAQINVELMTGEDGTLLYISNLTC